MSGDWTAQKIEYTTKPLNPNYSDFELVHFASKLPFLSYTK